MVGLFVKTFYCCLGKFVKYKFIQISFLEESLGEEPSYS